MKKQIIILSILTALLIGACAPAQPAVEQAEPQVVQEESEDAMVESEDSETEAMEESESEAMEESETTDETTAEESTAAEVSFSADVWPIIEEYALSAHGGNGGIFLENYEDISAQVVAGDPENSMLYKVLIGDGAPLMPPGNPLPEETIQIIYDWIEQGAQNN